MKIFNVCIVCPCYNEALFLPSFIEALRSQSVFFTEKFNVKVIFVDGLSDDGSYEFLSQVSSADDNFHVIVNEERFVSNALNYAVDYIKAYNPDYFIRMDMHAIYPQDYVSSLIAGIESMIDSGVKVGNYGGVVNTLPSSNSLDAIVISKVLSSKFGVGTSSFRTGVQERVSVDTVPFGCFPINVFDDVGLFDIELIRNQDDEYNGRLKLNGYEIILDPRISVDYFARNSFSKVYDMFFQYGYYKPFVNLKLGRPASVRQFAPPFFVLALFFSFLYSFRCH